MPSPERIAIIGMSGRFPKARNLDEFWKNLRDGVECISFFSESDLSDAGVDPAVLDEPSFVNAGAVLEDIDQFDASFFGFSPRDAEVMDPQHRIFLEAAYHGLEDAGYDPERYRGLIGVFAGASLSSYLFDLYSDPGLIAQLDDFQLAVGNDKDHLATQVSYKLNLRGPSMAIQTACSTSMVAVCMACQSLLSYQCDIALAGGVSADASTRKGYYYQPGGILSPDGHCRVFDASSAGTVVGNGVGVVVLKRLSEAIADRDYIRAVVMGFALNNDGSQKVGYTAPSVDGQAKVIALAQALAGVDPETIGYIEAHGTGTELGDPIEIAALNQVFRARTPKRHFCAIGSVKSNIGHLDTAAGIASLIKTVLALENKAVPPSLNFHRPNPKIDFANSALYVNKQLASWPANGQPRRAGVSCFGIGGTNAHVVMEEAPTAVRSSATRPACVVKLSAQSDSVLETMTSNLAGYLAAHPEADLAHVAYTCDLGRKAFRHRRIVVCPDLDTECAAKALTERDPRRMFTTVFDGNEKQVCYMFPGQGTQRVNMALAVYRHEPEFRTEVDRCSDLLAPLLGLDLGDLLYPADDRAAYATTALSQTALTQPALFAIEYALAKLWISWGVRPACMIGHSIGEWVGACLSGVFSLENALRLVALRGQIMANMPIGAMLAVPLPEHATARLLNDGLSLAAVNGPTSCVVAGPMNSIEALEEQLSVASVPSHRLRTSHAFHSSLMDDAQAPFVEKVKSIRLLPPQIPFISNVTGTWITASEATDPGYWGRQLRQTVRFADGLMRVSEESNSILLEVGAGQTLANLARQYPRDRCNMPTISSCPSSEEHADDLIALLAARGKLWLYGIRGDPDSFYRHERLRRIPLPGYPFEHRKYWIEPSAPNSGVEVANGDGATRDPEEWFYYPAWKPAAPLIEDENSHDSSRWLVFVDSEGIASQLIFRLRNRGEHVVSVAPGNEFGRLDDGSYVMRPGEAADYALLAAEEIGGEEPLTIVHCWNLNLPAGTKPENGFEHSQMLGFDSLVYLAQAIERQYVPMSIRISVVSNEIYSVTGTDSISPAKSMLLGPCRVIPQEFPNIRCQNIDLDFYEKSDEAVSNFAEYLEIELTSAPFEPALARRKGRRWIQTFEPVCLPKATEDATGLRDGGVYLITGGLGKIGLVLAECMARTAQAKLVLTGRSDFPPRDQWHKYRNEHTFSAISETIRRIKLIEELGGDVLYYAVDAADLDGMKGVVQEAERRFGPLNGVIHGAGNTSMMDSISKSTRLTAAQQFRSKALGLSVLDNVIAGRELDFVLLLSSLSSVLGGLGMASYAAGNIFMDTWASRKNQEGPVPWISVNWDAWQFPEDGEIETFEGGITPEEGAHAFLQILARAPRQVVVSLSDLNIRLNQWVRGAIGSNEEAGERPITAQHSRPTNLSSTFAPPRGEAERKLADIWQQLLGVAPIGIFDNFFDLGGHSLLAIQLISRIRETLRVEFGVHKIFEMPTVSELAASIEQSQARAEEEDTTVEMLALVEQFSDKEVAALLERGEPTNGNGEP
jgi:acyl transferase domain-containing protein/acyl carrier protein